MNVVLYERYSSAKQTEQSIEGQDRVCTEFCRRKGYTIIGRYIDRNASASKDIEKRTEFLRMVSDSDRGHFDAVIVYKLDRFSRDRFQSAIFKNALKKNGVQVISATENVTDTPEGVIMESVLEGFAEYYSKELSQKVVRGMMETAIKGKFNGGFLALGYDVKDGRFVINEREAEAVRYIFESYANRLTLVEIANTLNERGYRTKFGSSFNKHSFGNILHNRRYIGEYRFRDYVNLEAIPPIISKELFEKCQSLCAKNRAMHRTAVYNDYMLSGKLCCECGERMTGVSAHNKAGVVYQYYLCKGKTAHSCDAKRVRREVLDNAVLGMIRNLFDQSFIDAIADGVSKKSAESIKQKNLASLQKERAEITARKKQLISLVENGLAVSEVADRLRELDEQSAYVDKVIAQSKETAITYDEVANWLREFTGGKEVSAEYCRKLVKLLVVKVILFKDGRLRVILKHPTETKLGDKDSEYTESETIFEDDVSIGDIRVHQACFVLITETFINEKSLL